MKNEKVKFKKSIYFLIVVFIFLIFNFTPSYAALVQCGTAETDPCTICDAFQLINRIITFILTQIVTPLSIIALIMGGIILLTAGGSSQKVSIGKKILTTTLLGIILAFAGWLIINTILGTIIKKGVYAPWDKFPCGEEASQPDEAPSCILAFTPSCISKGESTEVSVYYIKGETTKARAECDGDLGSDPNLPTSDTTRTARPEESQTCTVYAEGPGGTGSCNANITVVEPPSSCQ
jgi:hypothetical protein